MNNTLNKTALAAMVGALLLSGLTGCGTAPQTGATQPAEATPAASVQRVNVPRESAKKAVLVMTGTQVSLGATDWGEFKEEWRATFAEHARDAKIAFALHEGTARPAAEDGTLVTVFVNDYRKVGIGSRVFFGIMTGNAYIDAKVTFSDLKTGRVFGEQVYNTSSSAWHGVFAKMTPQQVDAIATGVFGELKPR